ncbi:hypothetical protein R6Q59_003340 [Mikania micrantha]
MSSIKESVGGVDTPSGVDHVGLSGDESVDLEEKEMDTIDENLDHDEDGAKGKSKSGVWAHFINIELDEKGQTLSPKEEEDLEIKVLTSDKAFS